MFVVNGGGPLVVITYTSFLKTWLLKENKRVLISYT